MTEQDDHNFSSSSPHRLPTLSATQALKNLSSNSRRPISTRLKRLDGLLQGKDDDASSQDDPLGGVSRDEVTEICGPPGVGKTSLALQITANVLKSGGSAAWVDTSSILNGSRLKEFLSMYNSNDNASSELNSAEKALDGFHHFTAPTLPHLFALLTHSNDSFPQPNTSLLVIDNISTLFNTAFPKSGEKSNDQQTPAKKSQVAQWASGRRWVVMGNLISELGKLAVTKNIAIILISQMTTRIRDEARAMLYPAPAGNAWESGITARIVLFRDWLFRRPETSSQGENQPGVRFAGVAKAKNVSHEGVGRLVTFRIKMHGFEEVHIDPAGIKIHASPAPSSTSLKRRHDEVADTESEDSDATSSHDFDWDDEATLQAGVLDE